LNEQGPAVRVFIFAVKEMEMGSKTQKTEIVRHRKHASNKVNRKAGQKQVRGSMDVLVKLEEENRKNKDA
jgi:hypothetical protein